MPTAVVTGATSGIGRASALRLAEDGWWVLASGLDPDRGAEVEEELKERGSGSFLGGDITDDSVPDLLVRTALERNGRLDLLVNCAGVHFLADLAGLDMDEFDRLMAVNLRGAVTMSKAALVPMLEQGSGVIVNVASEAGLVAIPNQVSYNVSKAGMIMLTRSLAADYAGSGIRAISVCPGTTRTPLVKEAIASAPDPEAHERILSDTRPAKRLGRPEEIAEAISFVASDRVAYLNGTEVVIDGGYTVV